MRNIQFISARDRTSYPIYAATEEEFAQIFPRARQNVAFNWEIIGRLGTRRAARLFKAIRRRKVEKDKVRGIHGTLFNDLFVKRRYFLTLNDTEIRVIRGARLAGQKS
jgi:hypothetical protein